MGGGGGGESENDGFVKGRENAVEDKTGLVGFGV